MGFDLEKVIDGLRKKRPIFHSEADFQFALAWEIQTAYPESKIRMEYPQMVSAKNFTIPTDKTNTSENKVLINVDILVLYKGSPYPIELKYKTKEIPNFECNKEIYELKNHGAQSLGRYDFILDICRIESLAEALDNFKHGYTLWLTNDLSYPDIEPNPIVGYYDFRVNEGVVKEANTPMRWGENLSANTIKGRNAPLTLRDNYAINWKEYHDFGNNNGMFKYALLQVNKQS